MVKLSKKQKEVVSKMQEGFILKLNCGKVFQYRINGEDVDYKIIDRLLDLHIIYCHKMGFRVQYYNLTLYGKTIDIS